jgi:hypothetical protein
MRRLAGLTTKPGKHGFRAIGIVMFLKKRGRLEKHRVSDCSIEAVAAIPSPS